MCDLPRSAVIVVPHIAETETLLGGAGPFDSSRCHLDLDSSHLAFRWRLGVGLGVDDDGCCLSVGQVSLQLRNDARRTTCEHDGDHARTRLYLCDIDSLWTSVNPTCVVDIHSAGLGRVIDWSIAHIIAQNRQSPSGFHAPGLVWHSSSRLLVRALKVRLFFLLHSLNLLFCCFSFSRR